MAEPKRPKIKAEHAVTLVRQFRRTNGEPVTPTRVPETADAAVCAVCPACLTDLIRMLIVQMCACGRLRQEIDATAPHDIPLVLIARKQRADREEDQGVWLRDGR